VKKVLFEIEKKMILRKQFRCFFNVRFSLSFSIKVECKSDAIRLSDSYTTRIRFGSDKSYTIRTKMGLILIRESYPIFIRVFIKKSDTNRMKLWTKIWSVENRMQFGYPTRTRLGSDSDPTNRTQFVQKSDWFWFGNLIRFSSEFL
jgi:hypothetical protein